MWAEQSGRQWWGTSEHILCQKRKFHTSHNFNIRQKNIYCDHEYCGVTRENTGVEKYLLWRLTETRSEAVIWHFWHRVVSSDFSGEISNLNRQIFWLIFFDSFHWSMWKPSLYFDPSQIASVIIPGFSWWRDLRTLQRENMAGYRPPSQDRDHRTPMAWQHRDHISEGHSHRWDTSDG